MGKRIIARPRTFLEVRAAASATKVEGATKAYGSTSTPFILTALPEVEDAKYRLRELWD